MPPKNVDHPSLAVACEGDFRPDGPPAGLEPPDDILAQGSVRPIQQPIELTAAPAHKQLQAEIERSHRSSYRRGR
jgi:hypothetical protein